MPYGRKRKYVTPRPRSKIGRTLAYRSKYSRGNRRTGGLNRYTRNPRMRLGRGVTVVRPEMKFFDINHGSFDIPDTGVVIPFLTNILGTSGITQGNGAINYVGTHFLIKNLEIRPCVIMKAIGNAILTVVPTYNYLHFAIVLDTQCNGAFPLITDIWTGTNPNSFRSVQNSSRFVILKQKFFSMNNSNVFATSTQFQNVESANVMSSWFLKKDIRIDMTTTGNNINTIRSNNVYFVIRSLKDNFCTTSNFLTRVRFTDV